MSHIILVVGCCLEYHKRLFYINGSVPVGLIQRLHHFTARVDALTRSDTRRDLYAVYGDRSTHSSP
jgi:hypothetical protein